MNGATGVLGTAEPVSIGLCYPILADGRRATRIVAKEPFAPEWLAAISTTISEDAEKARVHVWLKLSHEKEYVDDALTYLSRASWFDLYKACEALRNDACREHERKKKLSWKPLWNKPWAQAYKLKLVKQNANYHRHAYETRPRREISIDDARDLLRKAIREWLDEKI